MAAAAPRWLDGASVPADVIAAEKDIYRTQVTGKPANIIEKILDGKIRKFFGEVCLVDQIFVKDEAKSKTIAQLVAETGKQVGDALTVRRFVRYQLGAA